VSTRTEWYEATKTDIAIVDGNPPTIFLDGGTSNVAIMGTPEQLADFAARITATVAEFSEVNDLTRGDLVHVAGNR